jgi:hypothetical protein
MNPSLFQPSSLQLHHNPSVWCVSPYMRSFFRKLIEGMGEARLIGAATAIALIGWEWPELEWDDGRWKWLYVARSEAIGIVKIGISDDPTTRLTHLRSERKTDAEFELIAMLPFCTREHEARLCQLMVESLESGYEWFRDTPSTRLLCDLLVAERGTQDHEDVMFRAESPFWMIEEGLRYVCTGKIPRFRFNARACSVCGSRKHLKNRCSERAA